MVETDGPRECLVDSGGWRAKDWLGRWRGGKDGGTGGSPSEYKQGFSIWSVCPHGISGGKETQLRLMH